MPAYLRHNNIQLHILAVLDNSHPVIYLLKLNQCYYCFKSGCVVRVLKHLKEDWFIVLP